MRPGEFEPAIPTSERPQTNALGRATTGLRRNTTYESGNKRLTQNMHNPEFKMLGQNIKWSYLKHL